MSIKIPYNVLIIEDNPGDFVIVEDFLTEQISDPVSIVHAENFRQASIILGNGESSFDVILLDLTLPDKTGQNLVIEILRLAASCPVIILTGYTDIGFSISSISQGVSDYLIKDDLNAATLYKSILYAIERRKVNFQLEESEKRYSDLFHLSPQPMWVSSLDTFGFLDVNNAAVDHYGYSREEFLSMTIKDITPEEDILLVEMEMAKMQNEESSISYGNYRHQKKNGEIILVEFRGNSIYFEGRDAEIFVAYDITERSKHINTIEDQNKKFREKVPH